MGHLAVLIHFAVPQGSHETHHWQVPRLWCPSAMIPVSVRTRGKQQDLVWSFCWPQRHVGVLGLQVRKSQRDEPVSSDSQLLTDHIQSALGVSAHADSKPQSTRVQIEDGRLCKIHLGSSSLGSVVQASGDVEALSTATHPHFLSPRQTVPSAQLTYDNRTYWHPPYPSHVRLMCCCYQGEVLAIPDSRYWTCRCW